MLRRDAAPAEQYANPLDDLSRRVVGQLPRALVHDLQRYAWRQSDRMLRLAAETCGAPKMDETVTALVFGVNGAADSMVRELARHERAQRAMTEEIKRGAGAWATGRETPLRMPGVGGAPMQMMPDFVRGGPAWGQNPSPPPPMQNQPRVRRTPYAVYTETTVGAGVGQFASANPQNLQNGTPFRFIVTHMSLSEGREPILINPTYSLQVTPNNPGKGWTKIPIPAMSHLTYVPYGPVQNSNRFQMCRWHLDGPYPLPANASLYVEGTNNASVDVTLSVQAFTFKTDAFGTPRILQSARTLAAGVQGANFDSTQLTGDGDADMLITDVVFTPGSGGNWGILNQTSPLVLLRPDGVIGSPTNWTAAAPVAVVHLNTVEGLVGNFYRMANPIYVPPGSSVQVNFQNQTASEIIASVAFVGYLEVPVQ